MDLQKAKQVIAANYSKEENSLCYLLNEECEFSAEAFWAYYEEKPEWLNDALFDLQR